MHDSNLSFSNGNKGHQSSLKITKSKKTSQLHF